MQTLETSRAHAFVHTQCVAQAPVREGRFQLPAEASHLGKRQDHTLTTFRRLAGAFGVGFAAASASNWL